MTRFSPLLCLLLLTAPAPAAFWPRPQAAGDDPLVLQEDFDRADLRTLAWDFTDAGAWRVATQNAGHVLEQHRQSQYEPAGRSPVNLAVARNVDVGDLVLDVNARSTAPDTGRRDLCFVFGYRDATHFYYAHLACQADDHHNSIFLVNGQPRASIVATRNQGVGWDDQWHHVRVVRRVADGSIEVFFDDMMTPVMTARDKTFTHGRIGLGSFDDTGQFDDLQVWGKPAAP
jgi:hypothetical protein